MQIQVDVLGATDAPIEITDEAMTALYDWGDPKNGPHGDVQWPALMRLLDRTVPEYRT